MLRIASIGNISRDYIITTGGFAYTSLGGNALFTALSSVALCANTTIFGNMGCNNIELFKLQKNIDFKAVKFESIFPNSIDDLITFSQTNNGLLHLEGINSLDIIGNILLIKAKNEYNSFPDTYVYSLSPQIDYDFLLKYMHIFTNCDAIMLCPVLGEIHAPLVKFMRRHCQNSFITIDLQGVVRRVDSDKHEYHASVEEIEGYINSTDFIKFNDLEVQHALGLMQPTPATELNWTTILKDPINKLFTYMEICNPNLIFMITFGAEGMILGVSNRQIIYIKSLESNVIDHLGAGDAAHASFVCSLLSSKKNQKHSALDISHIVRAGIAASVAGSLAVQGKGALGHLSQENFDREMAQIVVQKQVSLYNYSDLY
ncbi:MAG: PfkB family carbohydrate kinase [Desulfobulbaceae bacterium]